jgi:hypothetical protein
MLKMKVETIAITSGKLRGSLSVVYLLVFVMVFCINAGAQVVNVSTSTQLQTALDNAQPGQIIKMADGVYNRPTGIFNITNKNGTASQPITLTGSRNAVLTIGDSSTGYGLHVLNSKYVILKGFTTRLCKDGVMIDNSHYITIDSVQTVKSGNSGIHLRTYSSYCTINNCYLDSLGLDTPGFGEGIYVGSAYSNWPTYTNGNPDTCNYNIITNNKFGSYVKAENIDIKEGTKYGVVRGNVFNGGGLNNDNFADSWIDVKGNYYIIEDNIGNNTLLDGFQTHIAQPGWGNYNRFSNNSMNVNASGYGVRVQTSNSNGTALNNVICNDNIVTGAGSGASNVSLQNCLVVWNGNVDTDWNKPANWNVGRVPTSSDNVRIPAGTTHQPSVFAGIEANCRSLRVETGALLTVKSSGRLHVLK